MVQNRLAIAIAFFILPAVLYVGLITSFSFDLFNPAYGWQAYNYFAMALAEGRQAVPAEVIAGEGTFIGGQVFMYYGALPAALRLPLIPFLDLRQVPVSNLLASLMIISGQWAMQLAILRIFRANGRTGIWADRIVLVLVSFALWFTSGPFLIAQNGNFYHEPYAAAFMLIGFYVALLADDLLVKRRRPTGGRLVLYALLAGLSVFGRQTCAVGLYAVTLALLLPDWNALRTDTRKTLVAAIRQAVLPLSVLFACGATYIAMAYLRTGTLGTGWTVENYGAYIIGHNQPRLRTMIDQHFSVIRVIPNAIHFLFGGATLREKLILDWGGGLVVTYGWPVRWVVFAFLPLAMALAGLTCVINRLWTRQPLAGPVALTGLGLSVTMLLIFAYGTSQYRYNSEAWPVIVWLMLVALRDIDPTRLFGRWLKPALAAGVAVSIMSLVHSAQLRTSLRADVPNFSGAMHVGMPLAPELAAVATKPGARDPEVLVIRNAKGPGADLPSPPKLSRAMATPHPTP